MERSVLRESLYDLLNEEIDSSDPVVDDDTHLAHDLCLDSVDTFSLLMQVERCFRIRFSNDDFPSIETVGDILNLVCMKLQQRSSRAA